MAARSTRNKIRWYAGQLVKDQEKFQDHLQTMHEMSEGRMSALEKAIPPLLEMSNLVIETCRSLRDEL